MEIKILGLDPGIAILGFGTIICHTSNQINPNVDLVKLDDFGTIETPAKTPFGSAGRRSRARRRDACRSLDLGRLRALRRDQSRLRLPAR